MRCTRSSCGRTEIVPTGDAWFAETVAVNMSVGVSIRRVAFRHGTDAELASLHAVEVPIEVERGSHRMPQTLESYVALARTLPSQFDDHAWLVEAVDDTPIAVGYCWSNSAGDERVMDCDVLVSRERRREGIGSRLVALVCDETLSDGRTLLTWSTFDRVPAAEAFSRRLGAHVARVNRTSELALADVDWSNVNRWSTAEQARELGYSLEMIDGPFPQHVRDDAATFHHIMQTAPRDDLDVGDVLVDAAFVAELDRALTESGRRRWTALVREPTGTCVGGTEVTFEPHDPSIAFQQNTGVDPAHRGRGLAKWAKATMLERIRKERPNVRRIRTDNAFSNASILAINDELGFSVISTRTEWQADAVDVRRTLH